MSEWTWTTQVRVVTNVIYSHKLHFYFCCLLSSRKFFVNTKINIKVCELVLVCCYWINLHICCCCCCFNYSISQLHFRREPMVQRRVTSFHIYLSFSHFLQIVVSPFLTKFMFRYVEQRKDCVGNLCVYNCTLAQ